MFGKPRLVDKHTEAWVIDRLAWILENLSAEKSVKSTQLILPKGEFFPDLPEDPKDRAEALFKKVAYYCAIEDWQVELECYQSHQSREVGPYWHLQPLEPSPAGYFESQNNQVTIAFGDTLLDKPHHLIATFAHEIAHYVLAYCPWPEDFSEDDHELVTDLTAVYLGFGVFLANSAFETEGRSDFLGQGWSTQSQGYLSEETLLFALALFLRIQDSDPDLALSGLKARLHKPFKKAMKQTESLDEDIAYLKSLDKEKPTSPFVPDSTASQENFGYSQKVSLSQNIDTV